MGSWFHPDYSSTHLFNIYDLWQIRITDPRQNSNLRILLWNSSLTDSRLIENQIRSDGYSVLLITIKHLKRVIKISLFYSHEDMIETGHRKVWSSASCEPLSYTANAQYFSKFTRIFNVNTFIGFPQGGDVRIIGQYEARGDVSRC